jgi:hypothetical protein
VRRCDPLDYLLHEERVCIEFLGENDTVHFLYVHFEEVSIRTQIQTYRVRGRGFFGEIASPNLLQIVFLHEAENRYEIKSIYVAILTGTHGENNVHCSHTFLTISRARSVGAMAD